MKKLLAVLSVLAALSVPAFASEKTLSVSQGDARLILHFSTCQHKDIVAKVGGEYAQKLYHAKLTQGGEERGAYCWLLADDIVFVTDGEHVYPFPASAFKEDVRI